MGSISVAARELLKHIDTTDAGDKISTFTSEEMVPPTTFARISRSPEFCEKIERLRKALKSNVAIIAGDV